MKNKDQPLTLMDKVKAIPGGEYVSVCFSCGTCVSRCLIQQKIEAAYNPRRMMKMVMMDMCENAFDSPTTWLCSSCDLCYPACPMEIHISGVITAVKELAIEAVRNILRICWFDKDRCRLGISGLQSYRKEYDESKKVFHSRPVHDWSSHPADAMSSLALSHSFTSLNSGSGSYLRSGRRIKPSAWT